MKDSLALVALIVLLLAASGCVDRIKHLPCGENYLLVGTSCCLDKNQNKVCDRDDPSCSDGIKNQGEERVDCGGPCPKCPDCSRDNDCGVDGYTGSKYCLNSSVVWDYTTYVCLRPGTSDASCNSTTRTDTITPCSSEEFCDDTLGDCQLKPTTTTTSTTVTSTTTSSTSSTTGSTVSTTSSTTTTSTTTTSTTTTTLPPESCNDGVSNQDEVGVDCGGVCNPCPMERITADTSYQTYPKIDGDIIVWQDYRNGNQDVYMYDLSRERETQVTTDTLSQYDPDIYGSKIVWWDTRNGGKDIYMYDINSETEYLLNFDGFYS